MTEILPAPHRFETDTEVLIIGAGACGLTAALAASETCEDVLVLERDATPSGSTALSSGFIPAVTSVSDRHRQPVAICRRYHRQSQGQAGQGADRRGHASRRPDAGMLTDSHGLDWQVLDGFTYPGHSTNRMHAVPEKTGEALMARMQTAAAHVPIATQAQVDALYMDGDLVKGLRILRPDGAQEDIGCAKLILACNGYGGNPALVAQHIPEMREALYFGHPGNQGEAVQWGESIGARLQDLTGYQGHGSVAHPHGVLITWALMMEGGVQVNALGQRFANEHGGYSEASVDVLAQPGRVAYALYDQRLHDLGLTFPDYRRAAEARAVRSAPLIEALADTLKLPPEALSQTLADITAMQAGTQTDPFGRDFTAQPAFCAPYYAIKLTGALFHTQGGLAVNQNAQVLHQNGTPFANLYAGGGAACGVSGPDVSGYLSGNGLLTAFALGAIAGPPRHLVTKRDPYDRSD